MTRDLSGDAERKLERLLAEHGGLLRGTVARVCPAGISVDDVVQEARLRLWNAIQSEREITNPASYIYRVAVTATLDAVRRMKARREESLEGKTVDDEPLPLPASAEASPEHRVEGKLLREKVALALARLAPNRRRAVSLHLQGFSSEEVADLTGWSEPKARNLVYRGREDLREELRREGIDG